jgi:hypothetical protein
MDYAVLKRIKNTRGQAILETAIVFFITILFFGAIFNIWLWANNQIVRRQVRFNATRIQAGTSSDNYQLVWPVYAPDNITEDDVLLGRR